jgi:hypothetical protein
MQTTVKLHVDCKADMHEWVRRPPGSVADRRALLGNYLGEIVAALKESRGRDAALGKLGAVRMSGIRPPLYTWEFADLLVRFVVQVGYRRRWLGRYLPSWLTTFIPPTECRITALRLLA